MAKKLCVLIAALLAGWLAGSDPRELLAMKVKPGDAAVNPVTVTWVAPPAGSTISNTAVFTVNAGSLAAPISRVEWYDVYSNSLTHAVTTNLFAVTNILQAPQGFNVH